MKRQYLFQYRSFWVVLSIVYLALFLVNRVKVNIDPQYHVLEPTYHLILRNVGLIREGQFSQYSDLLAGLQYDLLYFIFSVIVLSIIIVSIIFVVQYIYRTFK